MSMRRGDGAVETVQSRGSNWICLPNSHRICPLLQGMILATQSEQGTGPLSGIETREKQEKP